MSDAPDPPDGATLTWWREHSRVLRTDLGLLIDRVIRLESERDGFKDERNDALRRLREMAKELGALRDALKPFADSVDEDGIVTAVESEEPYHHAYFLLKEASR